MKVFRKKRMIGIGLVVLLIIVYFLPIPVSQSASVVVHGPYEKALERIITLNRWKTWWPDSANASVKGDTIFHTPETDYRLDRKEVLGLVLTERNKSVYNLVSVTPADYDTVCTLHWKKVSYLRTALSDKIRSFFNSRNYTMQELLQHIKENLEDPLKYYGFAISIEPIKDTFMLVKNIYCTKANLQNCIRNIYSLLRQHLDSVHYNDRVERMLYIDSAYRDSVMVMAGFSITKRVDAQPPLRMMTMPKAHIVVGDYEGDYKNIQLIHTAIKAYMKDHDIEPVAVEYEKMVSDPRTSQDSMHVKVRVYHPSLLP